MRATRYMPIETRSAVVSTAQATANAVVFADIPYVPAGMIPSVLSVTTGAVYITGVTCLYNTTDKKVTIAGTDLAAGDIVSLILF